jgi:hypothetical protein
MWSLVIRVLLSECYLMLLQGVVLWGLVGLAGDWRHTMSVSVAPLMGAWIEAIMILIGVPIGSR